MASTADATMTSADVPMASADGDAAMTSADMPTASADGDVTITGSTGAPASAQPAATTSGAPTVKVKQEKADEDLMQVDAAGKPVDDAVKAEGAVKAEVRVKAEKPADPDAIKVETYNAAKQQDGVKDEGPVKREGRIKMEKGEVKKAEGSKKEEMKSDESKKEQMKRDDVKKDGDAKKEHAKAEIKTEGGVPVKRERSGSRKKKDKKKKDKMKKERRSGSREKKEKKDKKRKRSRSNEGPRKRKSKWGPDTGGFSMTAIPSGRSGMMPIGGIEDTMPRFTDEELMQRIICLDNLALSVTGQELIEFFNGAVLAVTANAVQQAANRSMAPIFACTVTEEQRGSTSKKKSAELKFRTAEGASVGMKLNGIEYKGSKISIKRPDGYVLPDDGQDPSTKLSLHEMSMAKLVGGTGDGKAGWQGPAPKLSIFNLPDVMSEQICRDLLSQFGKLRMLSLIRDLNSGKIKGYGIFEYDDPNDVELAITALNGFVCGQNVIRVQKLGGQATQVQPAAQPVAATAMTNSMTQKIVSNPVLAMQVKQGREVGSRPSTVVQLINAVYQEDLMDDQDYEDIISEVHAEASKHGAVSRVIVPKPAKDGSFVDGVGKIFVSYVDLTAARKFQADANGRKFENRVVCAAFYPMEKFTEGKYKLWST